MPPNDRNDTFGRTVRQDVEDLVAQHGFAAVLAAIARVLRQRSATLDHGTPEEGRVATEARRLRLKLLKVRNTLRDLDL